MNYLSLSLPEYGQVQAPTGVPTGGIGTGEKIISWGINILIVGAIILALFYLIWAGIDFITSEGDKATLESAKKKIAFAIVGLVIVFLAIFIVNIIGHFFGVNLIPTPVLGPRDTT